MQTHLRRHYCHIFNDITVTLATPFHVQLSYTGDFTGINVVYSETRQYKLDTEYVYIRPKKYSEKSTGRLAITLYHDISVMYLFFSHITAFFEIFSLM